MKIRYIILTVLGTLLVIGGGLIYLGHDDNQSTTSTSKTGKLNSQKSASTESVSSSSSVTNIITASGYNYNIDVASGLGGVVAQLTPVTKIVDEKTILDVIASIPNFNHYTLESITNNGNTWDAKINKDGSEYAISISHYQDKMCPISITKNGEMYQGYAFIIPENLYAPYRDADKQLIEDFAKKLSSASSSNNELTEEEAVNLANKYVTGSAGANTEPFKFNTKNDDTYYLKTDIKAGSNGGSYATVELQDDTHVHITAGVWTSASGSHAPFYDEVVSR